MEMLCSSCGKVKSKGHVCDGIKDTPRVNANLFRYGNKFEGDYKEEGIEPLFARELEREIEALKAERDRLREVVDAAIEWETLADNFNHRHLIEAVRKYQTLNHKEG